MVWHRIVLGILDPTTGHRGKSMTETNPLIQLNQPIVYELRRHIFQWVVEINLETRRIKLSRTFSH